MNREPPATLLRNALEDARRIRRLEPRVTFLTCGYDTVFTSLEHQVYRKLAQLEVAYGDEVEWSLVIVDDLPGRFRLSENALWAAERLGLQPKLRLIQSVEPRHPDGRNKGASLAQGLRDLANDGHDAVVYCNLNLKVHAAFSAPGLALILEQGHGAAIGTRSPEEGGYARGAGSLGRAKSVGFNTLVSTVLPELSRYRDTNAPMKVFSRAATSVLAERATLSHITMDCDWLMILHREGLDPIRFPIVWTQIPGSAPPWGRVPASALDVLWLRTWHRR
ncbi:MAG: hypothetical protein AAF658_14915 [Myxococcota bacterium]